MIISINVEKTFDKIMIIHDKSSQKKKGIEGESIYKTPTDNIILNNERLNAFPLRSGTKQGYLLSHFYST